MTQRETLGNNVLKEMERLHRELLILVGNSPDFKPKVYIHPLLKSGLQLEDNVILNGIEIPVETDPTLKASDIVIMDKSLREA